MRTIPRITEIIKTEPYKVTVRWTTGEIRVIDFEELFDKWGTTRNDDEWILLDRELFESVRLGEDKTLEWPIFVEHLAFENDVPVKKLSPISFDPIVLYEASHPIENYRLVAVG